MNRLVHIAAAGTLLVFGAAAQNPEDLAKQNEGRSRCMVQMKMVGAVKGMTVKGAPYSARRGQRNQPDAGRRHAHPSRKPNHRLSR